MILEIFLYAQVFTLRVCTILDWRAARHLVSFFAVHFSWLHSIRSSVWRMRNSASNCLLPPPLCRCLAGRGTTQKPINNAQLSPARGAWTEREQACTKYLVDLVGVVTVSRSGNVISRHPALWGPSGSGWSSKLPLLLWCGWEGGRGNGPSEVAVARYSTRRSHHTVTALEKDLETLEVTSSF
jgi:hypothetical protein